MNPSFIFLKLFTKSFWNVIKIKWVFHEFPTKALFWQSSGIILMPDSNFSVKISTFIHLNLSNSHRVLFNFEEYFVIYVFVEQECSQLCCWRFSKALFTQILLFSYFTLFLSQKEFLWSVGCHSFSCKCKFASTISLFTLTIDVV